MYATVIVPFESYTCHSLSTRDGPRNQRRLKLFGRDTPEKDIAVDIFKLWQITDPYVEKLVCTYLKENSDLTEGQDYSCPT